MTFIRKKRISNKKYLEQEMLNAQSCSDTDYYNHLKKQYDNCNNKTSNSKR